MPYLVDGHEALFKRLVGPCSDFTQGLREVADW
jgi:hypothetical protein